MSKSHEEGHWDDGSPYARAHAVGLATRKISETLLDFSEPIFLIGGQPGDVKQMRSGLKIAVMVWNALTLEEWGHPNNLLQEMRRYARRTGSLAQLATIEALIQRKKTHFASDLRGIGRWSVERAEDGSYTVRAEARLPDEFLQVH